MTIVRCAWVPEENELYAAYHDTEWGVPQYDDAKLFEHLVLETAQAGLSWLTILRKREAYRKAFLGFDPRHVSALTSGDVEMLMNDKGIIRNRAKITATVSNAQAFLIIQQEFGTFASYQWRFLGGRPLQNSWHDISQIPAKTQLSEKMSADMKRRGFSFLGPVTSYAHMQAMGMVNDHTVDCFRYDEVRSLAK